MTEQEWLRCRDALTMFDFLHREQGRIPGAPPFRTRRIGWIGLRRVQVSERKLVLFRVGCVRRAWHPVPPPAAPPRAQAAGPVGARRGGPAAADGAAAPARRAPPRAAPPTANV